MGQGGSALVGALEIGVTSRFSRARTLLAILFGVLIACALLAGCDLGSPNEQLPVGSDGSADNGGDDAQVPDGSGQGDTAASGPKIAAGAEGGEGPRRSLLAELEGFGGNTTGGLAGDEYVVTNLRDDGAGSLRAGAEASGARWITFADGLAGTIGLDGDISVRGDKTIDGRGADITVDGGGLRVVGDNVIISHLRFVNTPDDAVSFYEGRRDGWVHHSTFVGRGDGRQDGAIDIGGRSTDITVSWNLFDGWDKTSLATWARFNGEPFSGSVEKVRVTYHHNYFKESRQRQPLVRTALLHSYNNLFERYGADGTGVAIEACNLAEVLSENNLFDDAHGRRAIKTAQESAACSAPGLAKSVGDIMGGDATREIRDPQSVFDAGRYYDYRLDKATDALRQELRSTAGA